MTPGVHPVMVGAFLMASLHLWIYLVVAERVYVSILANEFDNFIKMNNSDMLAKPDCYTFNILLKHDTLLKICSTPTHLSSDISNAVISISICVKLGRIFGSLL